MKRLMAFLAVLFAGSIGLLTWSIMDLLAKQQSARDAETSLEQSQLLARQIEVLKQSPTQATLRALTSTELTKVVEEAAKNSQIPPNSVLSIAPQPPERAGKTDYQRYSSEVLLAPLSWREFEGFLQSIASQEPSLIVSHMKLSGPQGVGTPVSMSDGPEKWGVQLRLTQAVFAPITKGSP